MLFFLDEMLRSTIAEIATRDYGLDVISSHRSGRDSLADDQQLLLAAQEGRCVVTKNDKDFRRETQRFQSDGLPHAGVLVISRRLATNQYAAIARALAYYNERHPDGLPPYMLDYLHPAPEQWSPRIS